MAFLVEQDARMTAAERIQRVGFKRWTITRIESHAYFVGDAATDPTWRRVKCRQRSTEWTM